MWSKKIVGQTFRVKTIKWNTFSSNFRVHHCSWLFDLKNMRKQSAMGSVFKKYPLWMYTMQKKRFKHKRCGSIGDHKIWWKSHKMEHFVIKRNTSVIKRNTFLESGLSNWSPETLLKNQGKKFWSAKWSARTGNEDELKEKKMWMLSKGRNFPLNNSYFLGFPKSRKVSILFHTFLHENSV